MKGAHGTRLWLLAALLALAAVAVAASGASAQQHHDDWTVDEYTYVQDKEIVVDGRLIINPHQTLFLQDCSLRFTRRTPYEAQIVVEGTMVLSGSKIIAETPGSMSVNGRFEVTRDSEVQNMDVLVSTTGSMGVHHGTLNLIGTYTDRHTNDPLVLTVEGSLHVYAADLVLWYGFIQSQGKFTIVDSHLSATVDYELVYSNFSEKVRFNRGMVSLFNSEFEDLWGVESGIFSTAELHVRGCHFNNTKLAVSVPWWEPELRTVIEGSSMDSSDIIFSMDTENHRPENLGLDLVIRDCFLTDSEIALRLLDYFEGELLLSNLTIEGYEDTAVWIESRGFEGSLVLEDLRVDGPWGVHVMNDFAGMVIRDSTIRTQRSAVTFTTGMAAMYASIENVTMIGEVGVSTRNTVVSITGSDLSGVSVPVMGQSGSSTTLVDCSLDVGTAQLIVEPGEKAAHLNVERRMFISSVGWDIGVPIEEGLVKYRTPHPEVTPGPRSWEIGSEAVPSVRMLEWVLEDSGKETKLLFEEVQPEIVLQGHVFHTVEGIDPWSQGPYELSFHDDAPPQIDIDPEVKVRVTTPYINLFGTYSDIGTGLRDMSWTLETGSGEEVGVGDINRKAGQRWNVTIQLTGNMQVVWLMAEDRSGNVERLPTRSIFVDVPSPTLTISEPRSGTVTNDPVVHVSGRAEAFASEVVVHVVGADGSVRTPVIRGYFDVYFELPNEGFNQMVVESIDPFDGSDPKFVNLVLDTVAPRLDFDKLDPSAVNYVTTPSLVISGKVDDLKATLTVDGQRVGVMGDFSYATTVQLAEGRQTLTVVAMDPAGNQRMTSLVLVLDTSPPELTLVRPSTNPYWSQLGTVEVEIQANEPVRLLEGETATDLLEGDRIVETIWLHHDRPTLTEFRLQDRAGNVATMELVMHLDIHDPILEVLTPKSGAILNTNLVELVVTSSEEGCTLSANGRPLEIVKVLRDQLVVELFLGTEEGVREVTITLTDRAGNSDEEVLVLDVDTIRPFVNIIEPSNNSRVTTEPLRVRGFTEPGVKVVWVNDVMAVVGPDGSFYATIEPVEGWQKVTIYAVDRAGNKGRAILHLKGLASPDYELPVEALAGGTILLVLAALVGSTEAGKWSILLVILPLYTKLRKDKILDQRTRGLIQGYIMANPGCNYTIIRDNLDLADGTLTYHLQVLEREGFIYSLREGLFRCFYPQGLPPPKRGKLHLSDTQMDIVRICKRIPGITVGEIATAMNRRPNVISYHLKLLREGGLVRVEEDGRHVRVYPVESAVAMI